MLILKILCAPIAAALWIVVTVSTFLLGLSAFLFGLAGTLLGILAVPLLFTGNWKNGLIVLLLSYLVSPMGLPMMAAHLLGGIQRLRLSMQDFIFG